MHAEDDHTRSFFIDHDGLTYEYPSAHWWKIECQEVPKTPERPGGLKYSLAFFAPNGECLVRYDNSHAVKAKGKTNPVAYDHWHRFGKNEKLVPYSFTNVERLLIDFYEDLESHLPPEERSG
jgi:hypothetical protein